MAHDTHHDTNHASSEMKKSATSYRSAFWFVIILVGLFIAAVNFVNVMGHDEGEGHEGHATEHASEPAMEATSNQTLEGETGTGKPAEASTSPTGTTPTADTTHKEGH